jgi:hypothetical protein
MGNVECKFPAEGGFPGPEINKLIMEIAPGEERTILPLLLEWMRRCGKFEAMHFLISKFAKSLDMKSMLYNALKRYDEESCMIFLKVMDKEEIKKNFPNLIFDAIRMELCEVCEYLIKELGWNVNLYFDTSVMHFKLFDIAEYTTPLHEAVRCGNARLVKLLLENKADVNVEYFEYIHVIDDVSFLKPPLVDCFRINNRAKSREIFDLLVDHGALESPKNHYVFLLEAVRSDKLDLFEDLLKSGVRCRCSYELYEFLNVFLDSTRYKIMLNRDEVLDLWDMFLEYHSMEFFNSNLLAGDELFFENEDLDRMAFAYPLNEVLSFNTRFLVDGMVKRGVTCYNSNSELMHDVYSDTLEYFNQCISFYNSLSLFIFLC